MQEKLSVKENAAELLDKQLFLRAKKNQFGFIVLSSATDPYLHFEKELGLTRELLKIILRHKFPLHLITKSDLVLRDIDLMKDINENAILPADLGRKMKHKAIVTFSFSTVSDETAKIFEPGATPPSLRLLTMKKVANSGLLTGVSMMPLLPFISDTAEHLEKMFSSFKDSGASYVMPSTITLSGDSIADNKQLVIRAVEKHFPQLSEKYRKWFQHSGVLPSYYRVAFGKKMEELKTKYNLPDRILYDV